MRASDIAATGEPETGEDDIKAALTSPLVDPAKDLCLAYQPDCRLGGCAYIDNVNGGDGDFVEFSVHPDGGAPIRAPLLDLLVRRVARRATERVSATLPPM